MKNVNIFTVLAFLAIGGLLAGCVEPFEAESLAFENALVVDASLTNELKRHRVRLSRAYPFDEEVENPETSAIVRIVDNLGNSHNFEETAPGTYISVSEFKAEKDIGYQLTVLTADGKLYESDVVQAPSTTGIDNLYIERLGNAINDDGVSIFIDVSQINSDIAYLRYEYEETYKIIAPYWNPFDFDIIDSLGFAGDGDNFEVGLKPREREERVCFNTVRSTQINQATTFGLERKNLTKHKVRSIDDDNYIISHRYSILVHQYTQNQDAFFYYQNLNDFASSESVFSESQPGFLEGNISSETDKDERVLGYFEVAAVISRRAYFNYEDLFPNEPLPPYYINCEPVQEPLLWLPTADTHSFDGTGRSPLVEAIQAGLIKYHATNPDYEETFDIDESTRGPYFAKATACGDCTVLGSNTKPNFWTE